MKVGSHFANLAEYLAQIEFRHVRLGLREGSDEYSAALAGHDKTLAVKYPQGIAHCHGSHAVAFAELHS